MALITITDVIHDPNGTFPTAGSKIEITLSDWFQAADGHIVAPKVETASISSVDGTLSIQLESTTDGTPSTRSYGVQLNAVIETITVNINLGSFRLDPSPGSQDLSTLLVAGITAVSTSVVFKDKESPSGTINGTNTVFTLASTPVPGSEHVYLNGNLQRLTTDYTISGKTITFVNPPLVGDTIRVSYRSL